MNQSVNMCYLRRISGVLILFAFTAVTFGVNWLQRLLLIPPVTQHFEKEQVAVQSIAPIQGLRHPGRQKLPFSIPHANTEEIEDLFSTKHTRELFSSFVDDLGSYLDQEYAKYLFQESGLDTDFHRKAALKIVQEQYTDGFDRHFVESKVLALRLLNYSNKLSKEECISSLEVASSHLNEENITARRPALLDLYELGKICGRLDLSALKNFTQRTLSPKVRNQLLLAITSVVEENPTEG